MSTRAGDRSYVDLWRDMRKVSSSFRIERQGNAGIVDVEIDKARGEDLHLLDLEGLNLEAFPLKQLALRFLPVLENHQVFGREEVQRFSDSLEPLVLSELVRIVLRREWGNLKSLSLESRVGADLLWFVGLNLLQAVLESYAQALQPQVDLENWNRGNCPICGSPPAMERLRREDGKKVLWCGLCGTQWHYLRVKCPFCGTDDHNSLRYFFVEEDPTSDKSAFRVDVCDQCKSYIKTLDERKLLESEKPDLYLENPGTLFLDVLAQRDGYGSPTYWMMGPPEDLFI
jgi:FdhE protein